MKDFHKQVLQFITDRLFIMSLFIIFLFGIIILRIYNLQIIHHNEYDANIRETIQREIETDAPRGLIFDRYGKPIAVNKPIYVLNIDQGVPMSNDDMNDMLLRLIKLLKSNGDDYVDNIPISKSKPFRFETSEGLKKQFVSSLPYKNDEEREEAHNYTAEELMDYLKSEQIFDIDPSIDDNDAREIAALRYELYKTSWSKYKLITVANDISMETVSTVEERNRDFRGVIPHVKSVRYYPEGEIFAHVLGYTRQITASQFEEKEKEGYDKDDIIGQMGLEQTQEGELRGIKGSETVEVDNRGRKVRTVKKTDETPGNNVFITMSADYQKETYEILENQLTNIILKRLRGGERDIKPISGSEVVYSIVESNSLSFRMMEEASQGSKQYEVNERLEKELAQLDEFQKENISKKSLLLQWLEEKNTNMITDREILLMLDEQKLLKLEPETVENLRSNRTGATSGILVSQMEKGILKPSHMAIDPFSAAAVVVDVKTAEVLSLVGYPSYDPNELITNFNEAYPLLADNSDKRRLLIDRSMRTAKAPGSTFKMITGIAALEEGLVNEGTTIFDSGVYTKAGIPYAKCRNHGSTSIKRAIEVSCNYYFYETAFNLGQGSKTPYKNIMLLTDYVEKFGLNQKSGIELPESEPNVSSPEVVATKGLSIALSNMKNMDELRKAEYIETVGEKVSKGYIPWADSSDKSLEGKIKNEIQHELKRNLEPAIENVISPILPGLLNEVVINLENTIDINYSTIVDNVVANVMNDPSQTASLKYKTNKYLKQEIEDGIKAVTNPIIGQALEPIMDTEIKDAYEYAHTVTYGRLRRSSDEELVKELKYRMENPSKQIKTSKDVIIDEISSGIVDSVIEQMIEKVNLAWNEGITIRSAIGQGNNAFTPAQVANYVTALANKEYLYDLSIISAVQDSKGDNQIQEKETKIRSELGISQSSLDITHRGMLEVAKGSQGTARATYQDFDIPVGAKTGTAQDGGNEHSWFVGFAPYDNPEVAIVTVIYNSNGAGRYGVDMSREMLEAYFKLDKETKETTIDNIFTK